MIRLPGNVVLVGEFPDILCGFFIGSPALTRLALGLGRDTGRAGAKGGLKVNRMAELLDRVLLASEFPDIFCVFSAGSPVLSWLVSLSPALRSSRSASAAATAW